MPPSLPPGVMRWVGALDVVARTQDSTQIWKIDDFPVRFQVKPRILLDPEYGVPKDALEGKVDFFKKSHGRGFGGFLRMSPNRFRQNQDGELVLKLLAEGKTTPVLRPVDPKKLARRPRYIKVAWKTTPVLRPVDPKKLARRPRYIQVAFKKGKSAISTVISVPEAEPDAAPVAVSTEPATRHTEIQYHLLRLGIELGLDVWVAKNDRARSFSGTLLGTTTDDRGLAHSVQRGDDADDRTH